MLRPGILNRFIHDTEGSSLGLGGSPIRFRFTAEDIKALGGAISTGSEFQLALSPGEVTISEELDNYLPGYKARGGFRADEISPIFLVEKDVGSYRYYPSSNIYRLYHTETSYMAPVPKIDPETATANYSVIQHAIGGIIPPNTARQSNFDLRAATARKIADVLALRREYKVITYARTSGTWNANNRLTLTSDYAWNGGALSDPIKNIQDMVLTSLAPIKAIFLGQKSAFAMLSNPKTRDYIRMVGGDSGLASSITAALQQPTYDGAPRQFEIPMLPPFLITPALIRNETTGLQEEIIGPDVFGVADQAGGEFESIRTFQTFRAQQEGGTGWVNREFRIEDQGLQGVDALVAGYAEADVVIANDVGFLLKSVTV